MEHLARQHLSSATLVSTYNAFPDPVYLFNDQQQLLYQNSAASSFSGVSLHQSAPLTPADLFSEQVTPSLCSALQQAITLKQAQTLTIGNTKTDGNQLLRICILPYPDTHEPASDFLCIVSDLSAIVPRHPNDEGTQSLATTDAPHSTSNVQHPNFEQNRFLTNMTHELRTPLNGIIGITELLATTSLSDCQKEYTDIIQIACDTLLNIVNSILDFSNIENGNMQTRCDQFSPPGVIFEEVQKIAAKAVKKGIETGVLIGETVPLLCGGDSRHFRQIIRKILDNAVKFTDKGSIFIEASMPQKLSEKQQLLIKISDTGIGIPIEKQDKLFTPFFQVDNSMVRKYGGIGLGLALSQRLLHLLGGAIYFTSSPGSGSTFSFSFPVSITEPCLPLVESPLKNSRVHCVGSTFPTSHILEQYLGDASAIATFSTIDEQIPSLEQCDILLFDESVPEKKVMQFIDHYVDNHHPVHHIYLLQATKPDQVVPPPPFTGTILKPFLRTDLYASLVGLNKPDNDTVPSAITKPL